MDKQVDEYIENQKSPQKEIIQKLIHIFQKTLPNCGEKKAWGVIVFADGKFYVAAIKDRVHVGFAINGLNKEEINLFEGSGKTMRHIKIHSFEDINEKKLVSLIRLVDEKTICNQV